MLLKHQLTYLNKHIKGNTQPNVHIGLTIAAVVIVVIFFFAIPFFKSKDNSVEDSETLQQDKIQKQIETQEIQTDSPSIEEIHSFEQSNNEPIKEPLTEDQAKEQIKDISQHALVQKWLELPEHLNKTIVIVDNLAQEKVHKKDLGLFALEEKFPIENQGEQMLLDVEGYQRFNPFAEGIVSINSNLLVDIYLALEPGIEKLYQDLGYPDKTFRSSMLAAIENIQSAPLIYDPIYLVRPEYFYKFSDPALESLSPLDKQFIRMGPVNTMLIQEKLSEIATLLKQRTASAN